MVCLVKVIIFVAIFRLTDMFYLLFVYYRIIVPLYIYILLNFIHSPFNDIHIDV